MIELNRLELLSALDKVSAGLAEKESVAQGTCFVFEPERIYTFNSVIGVCIPFSTGLSCAVENASLLTFLRKVTNDSIILEIEGDTLTVQGGKRTKAKLPVNASIILPFDKNVKPPEKLSPLPFMPKAFSDAVSSVLFTVCNDTQMAQLCGVHIGSDSIGTFVESTDRERATRVYISDKTNPIDLNIPIESAKALRSLKPVKYGFNDGWEYFLCEGDVLFASSMAEKKFPDLNEKILKRFEDEKRATVTFPESVQHILDMAIDFAVDKMHKDGSMKVVVNSEKQRATFSVKGDYGDFSDSCKVQTDSSMTFVTHPSKLMDAFAFSHKTQVGESAIWIKGKAKNKDMSLPFWHMFTLDIEDTPKGK